MGMLPAGVYHIRFVVANDSSNEATAVNGTSQNEGYLFEDDTNYLCAAVSGEAARKGLFKLSYNFTDATISLLSANSDVYLGQQLGRDGRDKLVFNQTSSANIAAKFDLQINEVDGSVSLRSVKSWKFISVVPEVSYNEKIDLCIVNLHKVNAEGFAVMSDELILLSEQYHLIFGSYRYAFSIFHWDGYIFNSMEGLELASIRLNVG